MYIKTLTATCIYVHVLASADWPLLSLCVGQFLRSSRSCCKNGLKEIYNFSIHVYHVQVCIICTKSCTCIYLFILPHKYNVICNYYINGGTNTYVSMMLYYIQCQWQYATYMVQRCKLLYGHQYKCIILRTTNNTYPFIMILKIIPFGLL